LSVYADDDVTNLIAVRLMPNSRRQHDRTVEFYCIIIGNVNLIHDDSVVANK